MPLSQPKVGSLFELKFPHSVRVYDNYQLAQKAVDHLSDAKFAVENLAIVGTELRSVERVTGRRTWRTVIMRGVGSGVSMGLLFALLAILLFPPSINPLLVLLLAIVLGVALNVAMQAIAYAVSGGRRDFESLSQTVATKYEILCEHKLAQQARELLDQMPGERARAFE